jgi:uncharacterized cupredoxin-like copper-binding protein
MGRTRAVGTIVLAVTMTVGAACGKTKSSSTTARTAPGASTATTAPAGAAQGTAVAVQATEYSYTAPATVTGGLVNLSVQNAGKEDHQALAIRIAPGKTIDDVQKALSAPPGAAPSGPPPFEIVAGTSANKPGSTTDMSFEAPAGNYLFACFVQGPDGAPHVAKGMIRPFTVTGDSGAKLTPGATTVTAKEFQYSGVPSFKAGRNTFTFVNGGTQDHEAQLIELAPGKTLTDVAAFFGSETPAGPPPLTFLGGGGTEKGVSTNITVDLSAGGKYAFICLVPNQPGDGKAHVTKGMAQALTVT